MAVTVKKTAEPAKKAVPKPKAMGQAHIGTAQVAVHVPKMLVEQTNEQMLADELITLDTKLKEWGVPEVAKRVDTIKKELQSIAKPMPPDEAVVWEGQLGVVQLTACAQATQVKDVTGLLNFVKDKCGEDAAASLVKISLTDLKKVLSENEMAAYIEVVPGARTCKIVPKS